MPCEFLGLPLVWQSLLSAGRLPFADEFLQERQRRLDTALVQDGQDAVARPDDQRRPRVRPVELVALVAGRLVEMFLVWLNVIERIGRRHLVVFDRQLAERRGGPVQPAPVRQRHAPVQHLDDIELAGILSVARIAPTTPIVPILSAVILRRATLPNCQ